MNTSPQIKRPPDPRVECLFGHLRHLAQTADNVSSSRAALAELRRGLRDDPRDKLIVGKHVVPCLGEMPQPDEDRFYLVASLFASYPEHVDDVSLGAAFRKLRNDSGSTERRFLNLLAGRSDQLRPLLRQAVALLAASSESRGLDWRRLLEDLRWWDQPEKTVQQRWARDFYKSASNDDHNDTSNGEAPDED